VLQLLVAAKADCSWLILATRMMDAIYPSKTSVLTRATRRHISEDSILHSHRLENLNYYTELTGMDMQRRHNVFLVRYELGYYIKEEGITHSQPLIKPQNSHLCISH
jgi:hypothetical protein